MNLQEMTLRARDGYELALRIYEADEPKGVVKCIHGMEEYQDRYEPFAEYLQQAGYTVVTADLRGHGKNAPMLSHIADEDGHLRLIEDEETILEMIHENWAGVPVILFAHSMGTIIARVFLQKDSREFHKVVLSGYPNPNPAAGAGILLSGLQQLWEDRLENVYPCNIPTPAEKAENVTFRAERWAAPAVKAAKPRGTMP